MKKVLGFLLFITSLTSAMEFDRVVHTNNATMAVMELDRVSYADNAHKMYIQPFSVKVPERLGNIDLYHGRKGFYVRQDDKKQAIKKYFTDPILRDMTKTQLRAFLTNGYLTLNQMDDGEYSLKAKGRLIGGGPILGVIAYWVTKSLCYGTAIAATTTIAVGTAGTGVALVTGGAAVIAGGTVATAGLATATAIGTTAGVITGGAVTAGTVATTAGIVAGGCATAGLGTQAALVTVGVVTSAGGIAATIAGVETASVAVGTFFGMLPTP